MIDLLESIKVNFLIKKKEVISIDEIINIINDSLTTGWSKLSKHFLLDYLKSGEFYCIKTKIKTSFLKNILLPKHGHLRDYKTGIILFPNNVTVQEAVDAYKNKPKNYTNECQDLILFFKKEIKEKGFTKEIILERKENKLVHVDGLHRMIALSLLIEEGFKCKTIPIFLIKRL